MSRCRRCCACVSEPRSLWPRWWCGSCHSLKKRQKDLSPKPVHLLLGAAGATDGEPVAAQTASTHGEAFTTHLFCFTPLRRLRVPLETARHPPLRLVHLERSCEVFLAFRSAKPRAPRGLRRAFTAAVLLVN